MKKKLVILLAAVCAVSMLGGCGTDKKSDKKETKEEKSAKDIEHRERFLKLVPEDSLIDLNPD